MRKLVFMLIFFNSLLAMAQDSANARDDTNSYSRQSTLNDSINKINEEKFFKETMKQNSRNLDNFIKYQKEASNRQKRNAWIRIGLGIFFFIILVIGLNRQKKKRQ